MPTWNTIALFLAASAVLVITPGPVMLYVIACSVDQGRRAGLISILGVGAGTFVHVIAATIGISAVLMSSRLAFDAVKYAGAAYLIYLGLNTLLIRQSIQRSSVLIPQSDIHLFVQGVLTNVLNPKTALFFIAWLPRFIQPDRGSVAQQSLVLGCLVILLGFCNDSFYVLLAGTAGQWLRKSRRFLSVQRYVAGSVYILLGVTAAMTLTSE